MTTGQIQSMEQRLAGIGRRIDSLLHKATDVDGVKGAIHDEVDVWRRWRDELRVQAHLGLMDATDSFAPTLDKVEHAFEMALKGLHDATTTSVDEDELEVRIGKELMGLRREFESAGADFRIA